MNDNNSTLLEHKLDTRTRTSQRLPAEGGEAGGHDAGRFPASERFERPSAETGSEASAVRGPRGSGDDDLVRSGLRRRIDLAEGQPPIP